MLLSQIVIMIKCYNVAKIKKVKKKCSQIKCYNKDCPNFLFKKIMIVLCPHCGKYFFVKSKLRNRMYKNQIARIPIVPKRYN